jgi:uncharacterized protein YbaP (TraB family)
MNFLKLTWLLLFSAATGCTTIKNPYFWEIEKDGKNSYLLGTIHSGVEFKELPSIVHEQLDTAKIVFLETDLGNYAQRGIPLESARPNFLAEQKKKYEENLKKNKSTKVHFTNQEWTEIVDRLQKHKVPPESAEFYPLQWINKLVTQTEATRVNFAQHKAAYAKSMDSTIERISINEGKTVFPLDNSERMTAVCWDLFTIEQIKYKIKNDTFERIDDLSQAAKDYKKGDSDLFLKKQKIRSKELDDCLLKDRNKIWVEKIDTYHKKDAPLFVAGGLLHFIGQDNVIDLLQNIGYKVRRYPQDQ